MWTDDDGTAYEIKNFHYKVCEECESRSGAGINDPQTSNVQNEVKRL